MFGLVVALGAAYLMRLDNIPIYEYLGLPSVHVVAQVSKLTPQGFEAWVVVVVR